MTADRPATEPRTEELRRLLKAANVTEDRPWDLYCDHGRSVALEEHTIFGGHSDEDYGPCRITTGPEFDEHVHAELAVAAVNALPGLLALAEAAQGAAPRAEGPTVLHAEWWYAVGRCAERHADIPKIERPCPDCLATARDVVPPDHFPDEGAAPRAEGLDARDALLEFGQWLANSPGRIYGLQDIIDSGDGDEFAALVDMFLSRPSDERVPESEES